MNQLYDKITDVLLTNNYEIKNKYVMVGKCECLKEHAQTKFLIEINNKELSIGVVNRI